ncbi:MAG: GNAT family N-acetyltransferase [Hyphomicrobiaceae bacterium]|nr:GNAT family N-acetyltransferase [Hyphomicrobiaceae bacterium]
MDSAFEIRRFEAGEAALLKKIRLAALQDTPAAFGATFDQERIEPDAFWEGWIAGTATFAAFTAGSTDAGGLVVFSRNRHGNLAHRGNLGAMYVAPHWRGTGVAAKLVATALAHASGLVRQVHLSVTAGNVRAERFYRRMGFVEYGREPAGLRCAGVDYDVLLMACKLDRP